MPSSPGKSPARLPAGLVGMIVLIVAVEHWEAARSSDCCSNPAVLQWRLGNEAAYGAGVARSGVLCFGDSLIKLGIYPRILEDSLGCPVFNLALPAAPAPASYFLLRRALDAGARPRALVVDYHTMLLQFAPRLSAEYWPELLTSLELVDLSWTARDPRLFGVMALAHVLPSVRIRREIRKSVLAHLEGRPGPSQELSSILRRNLTVNHGAYVPPLRRSEMVAAGTAASALEVAAATAPPWSCHRANRIYVERFLNLARARGITVFWVLPPTSPSWQTSCEQVGRDARYTSFVREVQARYPNLVLIDARRAGFGPELFSDLTHLDQRGASAYSGMVATVVAPYLTGTGSASAPRWVALSGVREPKRHVALEDLDQSMAILRAQGKPLRR